MGGGSADTASLENMLLQMLDQKISGVDEADDDDDKDERDDKKDTVLKVDSVLEACRGAGFQFKAKSPMYKRYERYLEANPAEYDKYNKANRKDKEVMRSQWAEDEYNDYSKWRAKSNKYRNTDRVLGRLMNLDQLIVAEGGHCSKTAVQGALETARWCIKRGAPYIKLNKRSKRMMFRHITEENDEQNTTEWKSVEEERGHRRDRAEAANALETPAKRPRLDGASAGAAASGSEPKGETPEPATEPPATPTGQPSGKATGKGKGEEGKGKGKAKAKAKSRAAQGNSPNKDFEKEAKVILQEYRTCLFQGREILLKMDREDEKKGWAMMK
eukprot:6491697-Pyramimonas_sp.AAC.1